MVAGSDDRHPLQGQGQGLDVAARLLFERGVPEFFVAALDAVRDVAIYVTSPSEGDIVVYANRAAERYFQMPLADLVGRSIRGNIVDADVAYFDMMLARLRSQGSVRITSQILRDCAVERTDVHLSHFVIAGREYVLALAQDAAMQGLPDEVAHEIEALREERSMLERLARYADVAPGVLVTFVVEGVGRSWATYASAGYEDLMGVRPEDLMTSLKPLANVMDEADWLALQAEAHASIAEGRAMRREFPIHHPAKGRRWIEIIANHSPLADQTTVFHAYMHDISDRKSHETQLIESRRSYLDVFDNTSDRICVVDLTDDGRLVVAAMNRANDQTFGEGFSASSLGRDILDVLPGQPGQGFHRNAMLAIEQRTVIHEHEVELLVPQTGEHRLIRVRMMPVLKADSQVTRVIAFASDMNNERQTQLERFGRRQQFQNLVEHSPDPVVCYDHNLKRTYVNNAFRKLFEREGEIKTGVSAEEQAILDASSVAEYMSYLRATLDGQPTDELLVHRTYPDGMVRAISVRAICERDFAGRPNGIMVIGRDVTGRIAAQRRLSERERDFRQLVENSPDMISRHDLHGRRIYENPAFRNRFGSPETGWSSLGFNDQHRLMQAIHSAVADGRARDLELHHVAIDGRDWWSHISVVPEFENDQVNSVLCVGRDVTETVVYRERIMRAAYLDALTDLPNRIRLIEEATRWIGTGRAFAMMLMDLDGFKEVNDALGHEAGDSLLRVIAHRLSVAVNNSGIVCRLGGDEFAIMIAGDDSTAAEALAGALLGTVIEPTTIAGREIFVSASIGIAQFPVDGEDVDQLLRYADAAMYRAKADGRNRYRFYTADMSARAVERMVLAGSLRKADQRNEFELHYQPQFDLADGRLTGVEALLRWRHPELGLVMPDRFISIAEETGMIVDIGRWVMLEACRAVVRWNKDRPHPIRMSVNLSARQFMLNDLAGMVRQCLDQTGCHPSWLELEITESLLLGDRDVVDCLDELSALGVTIAIDDFGTGYSALGYLHRFPIHTLKIDRSFMQGIEHDKRKSGIVRAIISIASALDMRLVAEGVETLRQVNILDGYGCHAAQGYYFGRPVPEMDFVERHLGGVEPENPWDSLLSVG